MFSRTYSLRKSHQIMKANYHWYKNNADKLSPSQLVIFEDRLKALDDALVAGDRKRADAEARKLEEFSHTYVKKSIFAYAKELVFALTFALILATIIRQVWFEPYEIPSGSMRPTFEEQDRLTVTKTTFGINIPLMTKHLYFDPNLVQRAGVFIWSGDGIPNLDSESTFLGIFPYTKRYIKRLLGKPGDTIYFYGGKVYGFDQEGNDLKDLRDDPHLAKLEHIPFIQYEGRVSYIQESKHSNASKAIFHLFNHPFGKISFSLGSIKGEVFNGNEWVKDNPEAQKKNHKGIETYSDYLGIKNFAKVRLLTKEQAKKLTALNLDEVGEGKLYLELRHTPSLTYPQPILERYGIFLSGYTTLIPLEESHLNALMDNIYTARFVIKDGKADRYRQEESNRFSVSSPSFKNVPNGTYEFYYGKGYQIGWGGIPYYLPEDHPLLARTPENIQKLFNVGMEISNEFSPSKKNQALFPSRYAYFREGDLYVMGASILKKDDPILVRFLEQENKRESQSTAKEPYIAFKDYGPPLTPEGKLDKEFISTFGFKVPEKQYIALGDNHAMSQDSRHFGPVPEDNLQGTPSLILWPPGARWGMPNQKPYPIFTTPRLIVWVVFGTIMLIWYFIHRRNIRRSMFVPVTRHGYESLKKTTR